MFRRLNTPFCRHFLPPVFLLSHFQTKQNLNLHVTLTNKYPLSPPLKTSSLFNNFCFFFLSHLAIQTSSFARFPVPSSHFLHGHGLQPPMTMEKEGDTVALKHRKQKSREVSSRFLSPSSTSSLVDAGTPSLNQALSPVRRKNVPSANTRKHRSLEYSGLARGLWPSLSPSATSSSPSSSSSSLRSSSNSKLDTLADHLVNERLLERKDTERSLRNGNSLFDRQRSCSEFSRFEDKKESLKENHRPSIGGSMRFTGNFRFPGKSLSSSSTSSPSSKYSSLSSSVVPGRYSVDGKALSRKTFQRKFDSFSDGLDSESDRSDSCSGVNDFGSSLSSRKSGIEVSSKYLNDASTRPRRWPSDSNISINPASTDNNSPRLKKFTIQNAIKRANSLTGYGKASSQWALSPGRTGSQPMTVENKGIPMSFSSSKPPSPSRAKGVGNFLSLGLELFKSKKSSPSTGSSLAGNTETVHQFRLLHNRLLQWRFVNARADSVNQNLTNQTQSNLIYAWDSLTKLQHSVVQKKLQLAREKLEMKLNFILHSQIRPLEAWGDMERQHLSAVSVTKDYLHSVVCRVPLLEGAEASSQSASLALCHALDLAVSIESMLATFSSSAENTFSLLWELAEVVAQEKSHLEECFELLRIISSLEIQEWSLKCTVLQLNLWQHQEEIVS